MRRLFAFALALTVGLTFAPDLSAQADPRLDALKDEAEQMVQGRAKLVQEIIDQLFSFGELGMQEFETQRFLTGLLAEEGFDIELGVAGMPSAWTARWSNGTGKPVIAMGSDVDGIPQSNQKPGVAYRDPILAMAPGHGEGHNSGQAVNIVGALVVKELMERENIDGTLLIWPGIAEEQVASKAYFVREGIFDDVDVNLFTHVGSGFGMAWGQAGGNALWSVQYRFRGETAHSAGSPWRGRSALDAVMLMANAWEFKREHLRPAARSHYIIVEGGDQPNVVPQSATIWFYFRERDYELTKEQYDAAALMAQGAALMTGTEVDTIMTVGSAWGRHMSKPVAEKSYANIQAVGMPEWSDDDRRFAEAFQAEMGVEVTGMSDSIGELRGPVDLSQSLGGGSDDIGDISWNMPTVTLSFPSNMQGGPGHNWANGIAMATPIAHKGGVAGAKVQARTLLDLFLDGETVGAAWEYFNDVQSPGTEYIPMIAPTDKPAIWLNEGIMAQWRERMRPFYYDASKYSSYLEQLGIEYPTIRTRPISEDGAPQPEGRGPGGG
ncbi:MAG: peptidase dimerization domain-containing protein [Gemmatimonadetes bacterium]|nr:peptidase dimerization domain-containing protein [Gemmatimonadota bacterium]